MRKLLAESPEFARLLSGEPEADLSRVCLEIARDAYPQLDPEPYLAEIDALAERVRGRCPRQATPRLVLGHINWVLFVEEGFRGNTDDYDDPRNSYLNAVLDRRTGIPISLSAVYLAIAERLGLPMAGVNLPAHFMLRCDWGGSTLFVDPFHGGAVLDRQACESRISRLVGHPVALSEEHCAPCAPTTMVARMLRNLKALYLRRQEFTLVLPVLRRLALLGVDGPQEYRDLGLVCLHAGRPGEAVDYLEAYLRAHPDAEDAATIATVKRLTWHEIARWN